MTLRRLRERTSILAFEARYGIHTAGRTDLDNYGLADQDRVYYIPANWFTLRRVLRRRDVGAEDVFIDLGSGKGRMVLEAARYPFRRVIGVELAHPLHEIATQNVQTARMRRSCTDVELVCADVTDYVIPDDVTVVFLNNPFRGDVFAQVAGQLIDSYDRQPRRILVIYNNPVEDDTLINTGRFLRRRTVRPHLRGNRRGAFGSTSVYTITPS